MSLRRKISGLYSQLGSGRDAQLSAVIHACASKFAYLEDGTHVYSSCEPWRNRRESA